MRSFPSEKKEKLSGYPEHRERHGFSRLDFLVLQHQGSGLA